MFRSRAFSQEREREKAPPLPLGAARRCRAFRFARRFNRARVAVPSVLPRPSRRARPAQSGTVLRPASLVPSALRFMHAFRLPPFSPLSRAAHPERRLVRLAHLRPRLASPAQRAHRAGPRAARHCLPPHLWLGARRGAAGAAARPGRQQPRRLRRPPLRGARGGRRGDAGAAAGAGAGVRGGRLGRAHRDGGGGGGGGGAVGAARRRRRRRRRRAGGTRGGARGAGTAAARLCRRGARLGAGALPD